MPLGAGTVEGECHGKSSPEIAWYDLHEPYTVGINSWGEFTVQCPSGYDYVDGNVKLIDFSSHVVGLNGSAGAYFEAFTWEQPQLRVGNDYAAHFFLNLEKYIPIAEQRFSPFSRPDMDATVSDTDEEESDTRYEISEDRIYAEPGDVFNERGQMVARMSTVTRSIGLPLSRTPPTTATPPSRTTTTSILRRRSHAPSLRDSRSSLHRLQRAAI